jgi:hypothetical protein
MPDRREQLSRASEKLLDRLARLRATERKKRQEPISSPEFHRLARAVADQSRELMRDAQDEEAIGNENERGNDSIDDVDEQARRSDRVE